MNAQIAEIFSKQKLETAVSIVHMAQLNALRYKWAIVVVKEHFQDKF
jgi:hypothetical protein